MKNLTHSVAGVLLLLLIVGLLVGCGSRPNPAPSDGTTTSGSTSQPTTALPPGGMPPSSSGQSSRADVARLGVVGEPSPDRRGLRIKDFTSSSSPLQVLGVKKGDVIISCNGQQRQLGLLINQAIDGLQTRGEAITLVVERAGKQVTLTRAEKLP